MTQFGTNIVIMHENVKPFGGLMNTLNYKERIHKYLLLACAGMLTLLPSSYAADSPTAPAFPAQKVTVQSLAVAEGEKSSYLIAKK